jgi:hypothetical protein
MSKRNLGVRSLILASLLVGSLSWIQIPNAHAVVTNPTPVCAGAYCTITFATASDYYLWTVPAGITSLTVDVRGASGGSGTYSSTAGAKAGGFGAKMTGTLTVTPGAVLRAVAAQSPANATSTGGGGGGASYIALNSPITPYVVAGAGGGGPGNCCSAMTVESMKGMNASLTTSGTSSSSGSGSGGGTGGTSGGFGGGGSYTIASSSSNSVLASAAAGLVAITYLNAPTPTTFSSAQSKESLMAALRKLTQITQGENRKGARAERALALAACFQNPRMGKAMGIETERLTAAIADVTDEVKHKGLFRADVDSKALATFIQAYTLGKIVNDYNPTGVSDDEWTTFIMKIVENTFLAP